MTSMSDVINGSDDVMPPGSVIGGGTGGCSGTRAVVVGVVVVPAPGVEGGVGIGIGPSGGLRLHAVSAAMVTSVSERVCNRVIGVLVSAAGRRRPARIIVVADLSELADVLPVQIDGRQVLFAPAGGHENDMAPVRRHGRLHVRAAARGDDPHLGAGQIEARDVVAAGLTERVGNEAAYGPRGRSTCLSNVMRRELVPSLFMM